MIYDVFTALRVARPLRGCSLKFVFLHKTFWFIRLLCGLGQRERVESKVLSFGGVRLLGVLALRLVRGLLFLISFCSLITDAKLSFETCFCRRLVHISFCGDILTYKSPSRVSKLRTM